MKVLFQKIDVIIKSCEYAVVAVGVLAATAIIFLNVVMRYAFNQSLMWAEELTRYIVIWVTFIGSSICIRDNVHVKMDLLQVKLPFKAAKILTCVTYIICIICSIFLAYTGCVLTIKVAQMGQVSSAMPFLKMWVINLCVPIFAVLAVKGYLQLFVLNILKKDIIVKRIGGET